MSKSISISLFEYPDIEISSYFILCNITCLYLRQNTTHSNIHTTYSGSKRKRQLPAFLGRSTGSKFYRKSRQDYHAPEGHCRGC